MSRLAATLIDVGWGDSIFVEIENQGRRGFGLIDSNDTANMRTSYIFLKRYFQQHDIEPENGGPLLDFVVLTHAHADHGQGLKWILKEFGARNFWYPRSLNWTALTGLLRYAHNSGKVAEHEAVRRGETRDVLGLPMKVLWPGDEIMEDENDNSVVFTLALGGHVFCFTGDAEERAFETIAEDIPENTVFFKTPHHGSVNGAFDDSGNGLWAHRLDPDGCVLGISCHKARFDHPDPETIGLLERRSLKHYRTDANYHVTVETDGSQLSVKCSQGFDPFA
jgi:beta-lactamase superfamily II metal-dependent hydrolase